MIQWHAVRYLNMISIVSVALFPLFHDRSLRSSAKEETMFLTDAPVRLAIQAA